MENKNKTIIVKVIKDKIKPIGNSAHVVVPKQYVGDEGEIIIRRKYILCRRCHETFIEPKNFSPDPKYCKRCFNAVEYLEKNKDNLKCENCEKKITKQDFESHWDRPICPKCLDNERGKINEGDILE